jgi:arylsulfatase A-like enzyme
MPKLSRREFIKRALIGAAGGAALSQGWHPQAAQTSQPNIIIVLFDAMSASNMSLYGYPRDTTPMLAAFADRATVYHDHQSAGNFTTCGAASMLTGALPWRHRAFHYGGLMSADVSAGNFFTLAGGQYKRLAFCQNPWADRLVAQVIDDVDIFLPLTAYSTRGNTLVGDRIGRDRALAGITFDEFLFSFQEEVMGSSVLGPLYKGAVLNSVADRLKDPRYPKGLPEIEGYASFANQEVYQGVLAQLLRLNEQGNPYLAYFHLYSPHFPYKPDRAHLRLFADDFIPPPKPVHPFHETKGYSESDLLEKRLLYDQQVAHVDTEFGSLIQQLESNGILEDSYVIVTSDHGEMFERGFAGHGENMMYEPAIRIPLLIRAPGQAGRSDVFSPTSNIDLLPTICKTLAIQQPPDLDGVVLPGQGGGEDPHRTLFSMEASQNSSFRPIERAVIAMRKDMYKIIAYPGYFAGEPRYELYDLASDPEELTDLAVSDTQTLSVLKQELLDTLADANNRFASMQ